MTEPKHQIPLKLHLFFYRSKLHRLEATETTRRIHFVNCNQRDPQTDDGRGSQTAQLRLFKALKMCHKECSKQTFPALSENHSVCQMFVVSLHSQKTKLPRQYLQLSLCSVALNIFSINRKQTGLFQTHFPPIGQKQTDDLT